MSYKFKVGDKVKVMKTEKDYSYNHSNFIGSSGIVEKRRWINTKYIFRDKYRMLVPKTWGDKAFVYKWFYGDGLTLDETPNDILKKML